MTQDGKIEVVRMHRSENGGRIRAYCDLQFGSAFVVTGFKVVTNDANDGFFIGMPSEPSKNGKWYQTFHTVSDEMKNNIEGAIMAAYEG